MDSEQINEPAALIRWTYSHDEWKNFIRWKKRRKGLFHYWLHRLTVRQRQTPEITIHPEKISIGDHHELFDNNERRLQRVNIHDAGAMNVMEIAYERYDDRHSNRVEIHIPVPKGKLKEAIQIQERLLKH